MRERAHPSYSFCEIHTPQNNADIPAVCEYFPAMQSVHTDWEDTPEVRTRGGHPSHQVNRRSKSQDDRASLFPAACVSELIPHAPMRERAHHSYSFRARCAHPKTTQTYLLSGSTFQQCSPCTRTGRMRLRCAAPMSAGEQKNLCRIHDNECLIMMYTRLQSTREMLLFGTYG